MSIKSTLIQYIKKTNCTECGKIEYSKNGANYFFYLSAYRCYIIDCIKSLNIWNQISSDSENLQNSIVFQIDSYMKSNLLNYIIQHELSILNSEGYLSGDTDIEREQNYIYYVIAVR